MTLTLSFTSSEEAVRFLEALTKVLRGKVILGEVKVDKVKIFIPYSEDYQETVRKVKLLYMEVRGSSRVGLRRYDPVTILSVANLEIAIPLQALVDALRLSGRKASMEGATIVTDASFNEIVRLAEKLSLHYSEAVRTGLPAPLRRFVAAAAACSNLSVQKILDILEQKGLIKRGDGILPASTLEAIYRELEKMVSTGSGQ